jgi:hypothetical protein
VPETNDFRPQSNDDEIKRIVSQATENAKFKIARLKRLKERNELYVAARRSELGLDDEDADEDVTREL